MYFLNFHHYFYDPLTATVARPVCLHISAFVSLAQVNPHVGNGTSCFHSYKASSICTRDKAWLLQNSPTWTSGNKINVPQLC